MRDFSALIIKKAAQQSRFFLFTGFALFSAFGV
jgi:hypothetical protein